MTRFTHRLIQILVPALVVGLAACPAPAPRPTAPPPAARKAPPVARTAPPRRVARRPARPRPLVPWRAHPPKPGPTPPIVTPTVEAHQLKNGLRVLLVRRPALPLVSLRLVLRVGGYDDPAGKPGVASLTADLLNDGVRGLSALALSERAGRIGTQLSTWADEDGTYLTLNVLRRHLAAAVGLLSRATLFPTFPQAELVRRQNQTVNYVKRLLNYPGAVASLALRRVLYGRAHPYGRLDSGRPAQIRAITRADVQAFYRAHYRPDQAALVVVGDVTWKAVAPLLRRRFGRWRSRGQPAASPAPVARSRSGRLYYIPFPGAPQTAIRIGEKGPARKDPDMVPLLVMNTILGGSFVSRINLNLRERHGWTYGAHSGFAFNRRPSPFSVRTAVKASATVPAVREILKEVRRMAGGKVSPAEMRLARQTLSVSVSGWFVTNRGVASAVGRLFLHGQPLDFYGQLPAKVRAVTAADVSRVAHKHLHPDRLRVVLVGDPSQFHGLSKLGLGKAVRLQP